MRTRLEDAASLPSELDALVPDGTSSVALVQLAALTDVRACEEDPVRAVDVNVTQTSAYVSKFCGWARDRGVAPRVIYVSTAHVYDAPENGRRVGEHNPVRPRSTYARSKLEGESAVSDACHRFEATSSVCRVFSVVAPKQPEHFLLPGLIRRVRTGDLDGVPGLNYVRDFLDARDVARDLVAISQLEGEAVPPVLNVCSGTPTSVRDLLLLVASQIGDPESIDLVRLLAPAEGRSTDIEWMVGDNGLLRGLVPWEPIFSLDHTVREAVSHST